VEGEFFASAERVFACARNWYIIIFSCALKADLISGRYLCKFDVLGAGVLQEKKQDERWLEEEVHHLLVDYRYVPVQPWSVLPFYRLGVSGQNVNPKRGYCESLG